VLFLNQIYFSSIFINFHQKALDSRGLFDGNTKNAIILFRYYTSAISRQTKSGRFAFGTKTKQNIVFSSFLADYRQPMYNS
jgi:hypothetical protein